MSDELTIRLFATLKDRAGAAHITTPLPSPATVAALLQQLATQYPALSLALPTCLVSVNRVFAADDTELSLEDEIALFPPVSGGETEPYPTYIALSTDPPDIDAIHEAIRQADVGAIVSFTGSVRGETRRDGLPPETIYLEYEAYEEMALEKMSQIASEIRARWSTVKGIAIVQRLGRLEVGQLTTFVACAAGHRDQGVFDAARYGIDRLKEIVPVWKKEVGPGRAAWVEGTYRPSAADNRP